MRVITLVGKSNCGKTTTLKQLIFEIYKDRGKLNYPKPKYVKDRNCLSAQNAQALEQAFRSQVNKIPNNPFITDLTAKFFYNGKIVVITTNGDSLDYIKGTFERYNKTFPCDVFICASHDNKNVRDYLESLGPTVFIPQENVQIVSDKKEFVSAIIKRNTEVAKLLKQNI